jgi:hypothetical protein
LFPISSLDDSQSGSGRVEDISGGGSGGISRSTSTAQNRPSLPDERGHGRSTSLGAFISGTSRRHSNARSTDQTGRETPDRLFRESSPAPVVVIPTQPSLEISPGINKALPPPPEEAAVDASNSNTSSVLAQAPDQLPAYLKPHITSPTPQEFLLVTGTGERDPGVGMFVSLEGEVTRPTLEFETYPAEIVVVGRGVGVEPIATTIEQDEEGFVLASMGRAIGDEIRYGLEIQRWDINPGEDTIEKFWLEPPDFTTEDPARGSPFVGIRSIIGNNKISFPEVTDRLRLRRFQPFPTPSIDVSTLSLKGVDSRTASSLERVSGERDLFENADSLSREWENERNAEEQKFAQRLGDAQTGVVVWSGKTIWWAARNPLALQLDASIATMMGRGGLSRIAYGSSNRQSLVELLNSLRGQEAKTETEYVSLGYLKQRVGLIIFMSVLDSEPEDCSASEYGICEEALLDGSLDPRVVLSVVPYLRHEIIEGSTGIWVHGGVRNDAYRFIGTMRPDSAGSDSFEDSKLSTDVLHFLKRFLFAWRKKKGFGSVGNEQEIFRSVDAALLSVLLQLDKSSPPGHARGKSIRADLYDLVDHGVDCFDRAVSILESHNRLYVLSRLYQSRKMASEVLRTWRRIVESGADATGELRDGEQRVREYLTKIRNEAVVKEYGVWLAARNPKLGVQVFAEDRSQVKFEPNQVVQILREGAPGSVKEYLEYLVFTKNNVEYINELITYYLNIVTDKLEQDPEARNSLALTYEAYRALRPPKPTYRQFITDNTIDEEWWHSRLRLLQLLGGSQGSASRYDVASVLERIAPYTNELVPEVIILDGRQSRHEEALRLLTHGLGDYDTAINYCLLGGSSIYHPISGTMARERLPSHEEQAKLFNYLLSEFLQIEDISNRVEQTSSLLERFGGWFEVGHVLSLIPETWSVELVSGFLVSALRRIVRERHKTMVVKALSGAENLKVTASLIGEIDKAGPSLET